ncbi:lytic transglycosylase domain-containing protein [Luteimonas sp. e5]
MCLALGGLVAGEAVAGTLYRCDGADGSRSYSSQRVSGARCSAVARYTPQKVTRTPPRSSAPVLTATNSPAAAPSPATSPVSAPAAQPSSRRVSGRVYTYKRNGVTYATTVRPAGVAASAMRTIPYSYIETCFACGSSPGVNFGTLRLNTSAYQAEIAEAARLHGVDEAIIRAVMHAESAYNPNALSRVGAQGLMQLMPATARRFGVSNAFDPRQNIHGGVKYLAWLLKRFNGDLTLAAAGYNAGEGAVDKYKGVPPYNETRRYVERVRVLADRYRGHGQTVAR